MPSATASTQSTADSDPAASYMNLRQMITEDGRFVDIPHELLRQPPPKPSEFLYFQNHYERPSPLRDDLKRCKTTEDAIDLLATELETMHALVSGYVRNLIVVTTRFDEDIAKVHQEHASLEENFLFCQHMVDHQNHVLTQLQYGYSILQAKVELKLSQHSDLKKLPIIKPSDGRLHLVSDPDMTLVQKARNTDHFNRIQETRADAAAVESTEAYGHEKAMVDELAHPELRPSKSSSSEKRKTTGKSAAGPPFEPHVRVKVAKLTDGLETMCETFQRVQAKTEREFEKMRFFSAAATQDAREFWRIHDELSNRSALENGEWAKHMKRTEVAYTDWVERSDNPTPTANNSSSAAYPTPSSSQTPDTVVPALHHPQPPQKHVIPFVSDVSTSAYAIQISVEHSKPVDSLTRDEAIAVLKALPQQLEFVPHGAIKNLEIEQQYAELTRVEGQVKTSLEVLADKLEAEVGVRFHPGTAPPRIVPEKRTDMYEERFPDDGAHTGLGDAAASSAAKPPVAAGAKVAVASVLSGSGTVNGKGESRKRQRDPAADQSTGNNVEAEGLPERKMRSQKNKRVRKD